MKTPQQSAFIITWNRDATVCSELWKRRSYNWPDLGRRVCWGRSCQHKSWPHILFQPLGGRGSLARLYRQHNPTYGTVFGPDKDYFQLSFHSFCITVWKYLPLSPPSHVVKRCVITVLTICYTFAALSFLCMCFSQHKIHYFRVQADTWICTFGIDLVVFSCLFDSFFLETTLISVSYMGSDSQQLVSLFYLLQSFFQKCFLH